MVDKELLAAISDLLEEKLETKLEEKLEKKFEEKLAPIRTDILTLYGEVSAIKTELLDIHEDIGVVKSDVLELKSDVRNLQHQSAENQDEILEHFGMIREMQTAMSLMYTEAV